MGAVAASPGDLSNLDLIDTTFGLLYRREQEEFESVLDHWVTQGTNAVCILDPGRSQLGLANHSSWCYTGIHL